MVKNLSLMSYITVNMSPYPVIFSIENLSKPEEFVKIEEVSASEIFKSTKVMVNGDWIGVHYNAKSLVDELKKLRRQGIINPFISIVWNIWNREIQIWTDSGRITRPLLIVENNDTVTNKLRITDEHIRKIGTREWLWDNLIVKTSGKNEIFTNWDQFVKILIVKKEWLNILIV